MFAIPAKVSRLPPVKNKLLERGWEMSWHRESTPSHLMMLGGARCDTEKPRNPSSSFLTPFFCGTESLQTLFQRCISTYGFPLDCFLHVWIPLGTPNAVPLLTARTLGFCVLLNLEMLQPCLKNCMVTLEMWGKPVKFQDASGRLF